MSAAGAGEFSGQGEAEGDQFAFVSIETTDQVIRIGDILGHGRDIDTSQDGELWYLEVDFNIECYADDYEGDRPFAGGFGVGAFVQDLREARAPGAVDEEEVWA